MIETLLSDETEEKTSDSRKVVEALSFKKVNYEEIQQKVLKRKRFLLEHITFHDLNKALGEVGSSFLLWLAINSNKQWASVEEAWNHFVESFEGQVFISEVIICDCENRGWLNKVLPCTMCHKRGFYHKEEVVIIEPFRHSI
jgi:hypothetical protein